MIGKLAFNNLKKSYKIYLVYVFTLTLTIALFYGFNAMASSEAIVTLQKESATYVNVFLSIVKYVSYFVSFFVVFLMVYASDFFFKVRSKEYFVYKTLGMSKKEFIKLIFFENILVGLISLGIGLVVGIFINQILNHTLSSFLGVLGTSSFSIDVPSLITTTTYFVILLFIISVFSSIKINKKSIMELKNFKTEVNKKVSNLYVSIGLFILSCLFLGLAYVFGYLSKLYPGSTPFILCMVFGVVGTILVYNSLINIINSLFKKKKHNKNTFKKSLFNNRIMKNKLSIGIISLSFVLILTSVFGGYALISLFEVDELPVYDAKVTNFYLDEFDLNDIDLSSYNLEDVDKTMVEPIGYKDEKNHFTTIIKESEFKGIQNLGYLDNKIELGDYTYFKGEDFSKYDESGNITSEVSNNINSLDNLNNKDDIKVIENKSVTTSFKYGVMVIKDDKIDEFFKVNNISSDDYFTNEQNMIVKYASAEDEKGMIKLQKDIEEGKFTDGQMTGFVTTKDQIIKGSMVFKVSILFITMYIAFFLVIISLAILAIQQVMDAIDNKDEYKKAKILGMNNKEIKKIVRKNTNLYFVLPLIFASISTFFALLSIDHFTFLVAQKHLFTFLSQNIYIIILVLVIIYIVYIELVKSIYFKIIEVK